LVLGLVGKPPLLSVVFVQATKLLTGHGIPNKLVVVPLTATPMTILSPAIKDRFWPVSGVIEKEFKVETILEALCPTSVAVRSCPL
jgi:hypothetical protein